VTIRLPQKCSSCSNNGKLWAKFRSAMFDHDFDKWARKPSLSKLIGSVEWWVSKLTNCKHSQRCVTMKKKIDVRFISPSANSYPRPLLSTCNEELILAVTMYYHLFKRLESKQLTPCKQDSSVCEDNFLTAIHDYSSVEYLLNSQLPFMFKCL
jgi:hypothetical protein